MKKITRFLIIALFFSLSIQAQETKNTNDCGQLEIDESCRRDGIMIWITKDSIRYQEGWRLPTPEEAVCMCTDESIRKHKKNGKRERSDWYWTNREFDEKKAYAIRMKDCKIFLKNKQSSRIFGRYVKQK